jgi:hypothetical protein
MGSATAKVINHYDKGVLIIILRWMYSRFFGEHKELSKLGIKARVLYVNREFKKEYELKENCVLYNSHAF